MKKKKRKNKKATHHRRHTTGHTIGDRVTKDGMGLQETESQQSLTSIDVEHTVVRTISLVVVAVKCDLYDTTLYYLRDGGERW